MLGSPSLNIWPARPAGVFSPLFALGRPLKIAGLGDSIMAGDGQPAGQSRVGSWLPKAAFLTDGRLVPRVYGYGGTTAVGHALQGYRFDYQEVRPDILVYHYGHNDMPANGSSLTPAQRTTMRNAVLATAAEALAAGIRYIVFPQLVQTVGKDPSEIQLHNSWLATLPTIDRRYIPMPGFYGLYEPASPVFTADGVHPNQTASNLLAHKFAQWIGPQLNGVKPFRRLVTGAGAAGRLFAIDPPTLPFETAVGGGYPANFSEQLVNPSGLDSASVRINVSGDGVLIAIWKGVPVTAFANKWFMVSLRVKASLLGTGRCFEAVTFSAGTPDGGNVTFCEGQLETDGRWAHALLLARATSSVASLQLQLFSRELVETDTNATGTFELGELYFHDIAAMGAANGVDWNLPGSSGEEG